MNEPCRCRKATKEERRQKYGNERKRKRKRSHTISMPSNVFALKFIIYTFFFSRWSLSSLFRFRSPSLSVSFVDVTLVFLVFSSLQLFIFMLRVRVTTLTIDTENESKCASHKRQLSPVHALHVCVSCSIKNHLMRRNPDE